MSVAGCEHAGVDEDRVSLARHCGRRIRLWCVWRDSRKCRVREEDEREGCRWDLDQACPSGGVAIYSLHVNVALETTI